MSITANVAEWTNNFIGNDELYPTLHDFSYPWVIPALLGTTIPALMLATSSMLSDFSVDGQMKVPDRNQIDKPAEADLFETCDRPMMSASQDSHPIFNENPAMNSTSITFEKTLAQNSVNDSSAKDPQNETGMAKSPSVGQIHDPVVNESDCATAIKSDPKYEKLFSKSVKELSEEYSVCKKTIYNWRAKARAGKAFCKTVDLSGLNH